MPTLAELAQLSDNAYVGYPQLQRQANRMRLAQMGRIPENLPDPRTYGFVKGLTGTSPDELGMSVLSPNTAPAKDAAYYGYQLSNLGQIAPAMMPATKAALRTAGNAINDAMVYGTGPLARITPQPMRMLPEEYRGSHTAPNAESYGAYLHDLTQIMPKDVYTSKGKNLYGVRDPTIDHEWWMTAMKAKGKPDYEVEIYRAVPKGVKNINSGDWVTTSRKYAEDHGESALGGDYEIISKKVKAKNLSTAGDPQEYGYHETK